MCDRVRSGQVLLRLLVVAGLLVMAASISSAWAATESGDAAQETERRDTGLDSSHAAGGVEHNADTPKLQQLESGRAVSGLAGALDRRIERCCRSGIDQDRVGHGANDVV